MLILVINIFFAGASSLANEQNANYKTKINLELEQEKIDKVYQRFVEHIGKNHEKYSINLVESPQINAYASMGKRIVINSALVEFLNNDTALNFVIAHELGHIEEKHVWKGIARQGLSSLLSYYVFKESRVLHGVDRLHSLHYSRSKEKEADLFAVELMNELYCKVPGKLQFFEKMSEQRKSPKLMEYLSTHPLADTRLAYLEAEITKANCLI